MKNSTTLLICFFLLFTCRAQTAELIKPKPTAAKEISPVTVQPEFPGGKAELTIFMKKNIAYPITARENNIQGTVEVTFVVDATGRITNAKVTKGIGGGCDEEALKLVAKMPDWSPGMRDGTASDIKVALPVKFQLF